MTRHEREEFGPETRDVIEGLRRLALDAEPPGDLLARVKQWGGRSLSHQGADIGHWRRILPQWAWRPVVWGPAVAALCFIAGVFVPPPDFTPWPKEVASQAPAPPPRQPQGKAEQAAGVEQYQLTEGSEVQSPGNRQLTARFVVAHVSPPAVSSSPITITLSSALYERLLWEAQRRPGGLPAVLHEAVATYVHTDRSE
jgi:hypothetical protein